MRSGVAHDLTRPGDAPGREHTPGSAIGSRTKRPTGQERVPRGPIGNVVKGAFKLYLVPARTAQNALSTVTDGWRHLVDEARQEHSAQKRSDDVTELGAEPAAAAPAVAASALAPPASEPAGSLIHPGAEPTGSLIHPGAEPTGSLIRPGAEPADSLILPGTTEAEATETPSPTLMETGESSVEVRPNPAISPPHATSGIIGHVPPEVRHKLAGNGPIRA